MQIVHGIVRRFVRRIGLVKRASKKLLLGVRVADTRLILLLSSQLTHDCEIEEGHFLGFRGHLALVHARVSGLHVSEKKKERKMKGELQLFKGDQPAHSSKWI
jgi:hypothetical protein